MHISGWHLIVEDGVGAHVGEEAGVVKEFSVALDAQLASSTPADYPFSLVNRSPRGNELERMRVPIRRFEPWTLGTKRTVLNAIITNLASQRAEEKERHVLIGEELMDRYEALAGEQPDEDLATAVVICLCAKYLKDRLESATKDMSYPTVKELI